MTELATRIIPRLSADERRAMAKSTVQLAMLGGHKGITIERRDKVPDSAIKSLIVRGLVRAKPDSKARVMPLTTLGVQVSEALAPGMSASGQDPKGLEANRPASPAREAGDAQ